MKIKPFILSFMVLAFSGVAVSGTKSIIIDFTLPTLTKDKQKVLLSKLEKIEQKAYLKYGKSDKVVSQLRYESIKTRLTAAETYLKERIPYHAKYQLDAAEGMLDLPKRTRLPGFY